MTDVHGEPQQGGYLPAEIWHAYMAAVTEGKPCVPFPPTKGSDLLQAVLRQVRQHRGGAGRAKPNAHSAEPTITKPRRHGKGHGAPDAGDGFAPSEPEPVPHIHETEPAPRPQAPSTPSTPPSGAGTENQAGGAGAP